MSTSFDSALLSIAAAAALATVVPVVNLMVNGYADHQLTLEVDGRYYIAETPISKRACLDRLQLATEWTDGHHRFTCNPIPAKG